MRTKIHMPVCTHVSVYTYAYSVCVCMHVYPKETVYCQKKKINEPEVKDTEL